MPTKYDDIELAFNFVSSGQLCEHEAYLNIHTGEIYWYSEFSDIEDELPEDISDKNKYIAIPHKNDLGLGKRIVLNFSYEFLPKKAEEIEEIFHHRGAYSKFKNILEKAGLIEKWYEFENKTIDNALREWCKQNEIDINN
ncbi:MAG: hypothetical protein ACN4GM_01600 [Gammaproteobacteria bacterium]